MGMAISSYLIQAGLPERGRPIYWIGFYSVFTFLDCIGIKESSTGQIIATTCCVAFLVFYGIVSAISFDINNAISTGIIIDGATGFFKGLPYALQLFDGFEELPLMMTYALDPQTNMPKALFCSYVTVAVLSIGVFVTGTGTAPFQTLIEAPAPLMFSVDTLFGSDTPISDTISVLIVLGLVVNFFAFILFTSQQVCAVAEAELLPGFLAYRHPLHGAPINASIASSVIGLILCSGFTFFFGNEGAQFTLVTAGLLPTVAAYMLLLQAFIHVYSIESLRDEGVVLSPRQRQRVGYDPGPLRYAYGVIGARIAQIMCVIFFCALMLLCILYEECLNGLIVILVLGTVFYLIMRFNNGRIKSRNKNKEHSFEDIHNNNNNYDNSSNIRGNSDPCAEGVGSEIPDETDSKVNGPSPFHVEIDSGFGDKDNNSDDIYSYLDQGLVEAFASRLDEFDEELDHIDESVGLMARSHN